MMASLAGRARAWTDQDEEQLRRLLLDGEYIQVIARMLGRSQAAVAARASKLRLPVRWAPGRPSNSILAGAVRG
jgi:hypothetical protein